MSSISSGSRCGHASGTSGQYVATIAMLALLVRDCLDRREFELLYPALCSAQLILIAKLERE